MMTTNDLSLIRRETAALLSEELGLPVEVAYLEADLLIGKAIGLSRVQILAGKQISDKEFALLSPLIQRRLQHEPMAYILGEKEFYGRTFKVDRRVLIPRPETELLVELALKAIGEMSAPLVLDLGTGSGCIAVTLAAEAPGVKVVATDLHDGALEVACENARNLQPGAALEFIRAGWCAAFELAAGEEIVIVSNPPYVSEDEELEPDVRGFEPHSALFAANQGLSDLEELIGHFERLVAARPVGNSPKQVMLLEIGTSQQNRLESRVLSGAILSAVFHNDLAGQPRVLELKPAR